MSQAATEAPKAVDPRDLSEVLTLAEAAEYLRVAESDILDLAMRHEMPARKIGDQWRFHKQAIVDWLMRSSPRERLLEHAGALKDDPYLEEMLQKIYEERGRPMTEDE